MKSFSQRSTQKFMSSFIFRLRGIQGKNNLIHFSHFVKGKRRILSELHDVVCILFICCAAVFETIPLWWFHFGYLIFLFVCLLACLSLLLYFYLLVYLSFNLLLPSSFVIFLLLFLFIVLLTELVISTFLLFLFPLSFPPPSNHISPLIFYITFYTFK